MDDQIRTGPGMKLSVRETVLSGDRRSIEAFANFDGVTLATIALDCENESIGVELMARLIDALTARSGGILLARSPLKPN